MTSKKLSELVSGEKGIIREILRYKNENECMGIYPDMNIEVLTTDAVKGPCIIKSDNSGREIIMKKEIASQIIIDTE